MIFEPVHLGEVADTYKCRCFLLSINTLTLGLSADSAFPAFTTQLVVSIPSVGDLIFVLSLHLPTEYIVLTSTAFLSIIKAVLTFSLGPLAPQRHEFCCHLCPAVRHSESKGSRYGGQHRLAQHP